MCLEHVRFQNAAEFGRGWPIWKRMAPTKLTISVATYRKVFREVTHWFREL